MEFAAATRGDLDAVWPNLAPRTTAEYRLAGVSVGMARGMFRDWIKSGTATVITDGETRLAILAWEMRDRSMVTSFAGTEAFFETRYVRPFRRYLQDLQARNGNSFLVAHSYSEHPRVAKWFATLGYEVNSEQGQYRLFVLNPR